MTDLRHGVFQVGPHLVGVAAERIHEIFLLGEVRVPPRCPPHQRGAAVLRGRVFPALDLRVCLGHGSARRETDDLVALLSDREDDHRRWLAELEASVRERRPFGGEVDPHRCRFGRWYDAFRTDDAVLRGELQKFEEPHAAIHALAGEVHALQAQGRADDALRRISEAQGGVFRGLVAQFEVARRAVRDAHREVGVTVELAGCRAVLVVDRAEAVAELQPFTGSDDPLASGALRVDLVPRLATWRGSPAPVLLLDLEKLAALAA